MSEWQRTDDGEWVYVNADAVSENLPAGLLEAFGVWLTEEERLSRLSFVVGGVVLDFRKAVVAASHSVGCLDATLIPLPCFRHAQMMIWYFLGLDCGYEGVDALRLGWQDSEVYLRSLYTATRMGSNRFADASASGSGLPRYSRTSGASSPSAPSSSSGSYIGLSGEGDLGSISYIPGDVPGAVGGGL